MLEYQLVLGGKNMGKKKNYTKAEIELTEELMMAFLASALPTDEFAALAKITPRRVELIDEIGEQCSPNLYEAYIAEEKKQAEQIKNSLDIKFSLTLPYGASSNSLISSKIGPQSLERERDIILCILLMKINLKGYPLFSYPSF